MTNLDLLMRRYAELCTQLDSKDEAIVHRKETLRRTNDLNSHIITQQNKLDDTKRVVESFRKENAKLKIELAKRRHDQHKLSFVSVLVDGDCTNFQKEFIQNGKIGGNDAARDLIKAVTDHVHKVDPDAPANMSVKVRVYANVGGLAGAYRNALILGESQGLDAFIQGFNKADAFCDFVDVGDGKECSDEKVKALFRQDITDTHCRRVILCASADNGYAQLLLPYQGSERISLIEARPFAYQMRGVARGFETASFDHLFMSRKMDTTKSKSWNGATEPTQTAQHTPEASATPPPNLTVASWRIPTGPTKPKLLVCVNGDGQRVDVLLNISAKSAIQAMKQRKLCNAFHILDECPWMKCEHVHSNAILSAQEMTDLLYISRSLPCPVGSACRDVTCLLGHRCPFGDTCCYRTLEGHPCKFDQALHAVDPTVCKVLEEFQLS
ncbi:hypothetical protein BDW62DRAFT_214600 [Aspergillus aurantiobrunneus]